MEFATHGSFLDSGCRFVGLLVLRIQLMLDGTYESSGTVISARAA